MRLHEVATTDTTALRATLKNSRPSSGRKLCSDEVEETKSSKRNFVESRDRDLNFSCTEKAFIESDLSSIMTQCAHEKHGGLNSRGVQEGFTLAS